MLLSLLIACSPLPAPDAAPGPSVVDAAPKDVEQLSISSSLFKNGGDFMVWTFTVVNKGGPITNPPYFLVQADIPTITEDDASTLDAQYVQEVDDQYYNAGSDTTSTLVHVDSDGALIALKSGMNPWASEQFCVRIVSTDSFTAPEVRSYLEDPREEEPEDSGKDTGGDTGKDTGGDTGKDTGGDTGRDTGKDTGR